MTRAEGVPGRRVVTRRSRGTDPSSWRIRLPDLRFVGPCDRRGVRLWSCSAGWRETTCGRPRCHGSCCCMPRCTRPSGSRRPFARPFSARAGCRRSSSGSCLAPARPCDCSRRRSPGAPATCSRGSASCSWSAPRWPPRRPWAISRHTDFGRSWRSACGMLRRWGRSPSWRMPWRWAPPRRRQAAAAVGLSTAGCAARVPRPSSSARCCPGRR